MRGGLMRYVMIGCCLAVASLIASPAEAQVHVDIGINLPGPPALVVVPGTPVYYAPRAPANVFFYAHQYWVFGDGGWYVGPTWSGPWAVVERSEEHTSELQSLAYLVCRLLLEKKKKYVQQHVPNTTWCLTYAASGVS